MFVAGKANSEGRGLTLRDLKTECEIHEQSVRRRRVGNNPMERYFYVLIQNDKFILDQNYLLFI